MRAGIFLRAVFQKVDERIAAVKINPAASLGGSRQVVVGIKPWIGLAALGCSVQQVMSERVHARRTHVGIAFQIKCGVEELSAQEQPPDGSFESMHFYNLSRGTTRRTVAFD